MHKDFPIKIFDGFDRKYIEIKNSDELIELVDRTYSRVRESKKHPDLYEDVLWRLTIGEDEKTGTMQLFDKRTFFLIKNYIYYLNNPSSGFNCKAWFESVSILNLIYAQNNYR